MNELTLVATRTMKAHGREYAAGDEVPWFPTAPASIRRGLLTIKVGETAVSGRQAAEVVEHLQMTCQECGRTFKNAAGLAIHKARSHG